MQRSAETPLAGVPLLTLQQLPQRVRDIATLRGLGYSYRKIAQVFEVTPQAVSIMLSRHRTCLTDLRSSPDLAGLSPRAVNALARHGIASRKEADGRDVLAMLRGQRNCGRKTMDEIAGWLEGQGNKEGGYRPPDGDQARFGTPEMAGCVFT